MKQKLITLDIKLFEDISTLAKSTNRSFVGMIRELLKLGLTAHNSPLNTPSVENKPSKLFG
jgi:hypothetical protein